MHTFNAILAMTTAIAVFSAIYTIFTVNTHFAVKACITIATGDTANASYAVPTSNVRFVIFFIVFMSQCKLARNTINSLSSRSQKSSNELNIIVAPMSSSSYAISFIMSRLNRASTFTKCQEVYYNHQKISLLVVRIVDIIDISGPHFSLQISIFAKNFK